MHRVLKPIYIPLPSRPDEIVRFHRVEWEQVGTAKDMQDALAQFPRNARNGYSPVLEQTN